MANRLPFSQPVIKLFQLAEKGKVKLYVSSHYYATTHYLLKKRMDEETLRQLLLSLLNTLTIIVTRNLKDFKDTDIKVLPPDELLNYI